MFKFKKEKVLKLKYNILQEWKINVSNKLIMKDKSMRLSFYHQRKKVYNYFQKWILNFHQSKKLHEFFDKNRLKRLKIWFNLWKKVRCQNFIISNMNHSKNTLLVQNSFNAIRDHISKIKDKKQYYKLIKRKFLLRRFIKIIAKTSKKYKRIHEYVIYG